jgi:orotate phosphoribosyltransferase
MGVEEIENSLTLSESRSRPRLKELIRKYGIVFRHVKLSSDKETDYYYDIKKVAFHPKGIHLLGDLLLTEIAKYRPKSVGGLEIGAAPLTTSVIIKSTEDWKSRNGLNGFLIRKNPKKHGLEKKIEGILDSPVVIVDDVVTSGQSVKDAIDAVNNEGFRVNGVVCVIDREEEGTVNVLKEHNIRYSALFQHSEFKPFIEERLRVTHHDNKIRSI